MNRHSAELPHEAVWVFSGTADGNALARELTERHHRVVVSTASDYGRELVEANIPHASVVSGRIGHKARLQLMKDHAARAIVDATHPFATEISKQLQALARELDLPYLRYERPGTPKSAFCPLLSHRGNGGGRSPAPRQTYFPRHRREGSPDFLQTHRARSQVEWFVRITPEKDSLNQALAAGIPRATDLRHARPRFAAAQRRPLERMGNRLRRHQGIGRCGRFFRQARSRPRTGPPPRRHRASRAPLSRALRDLPGSSSANWNAS
jgi:hypothetical protein